MYVYYRGVKDKVTENKVMLFCQKQQKLIEAKQVTDRLGLVLVFQLLAQLIRMQGVGMHM